MNIIVFGSGCCKCETLLNNTKEAIQRLGYKANIQYITDYDTIANYGIMRTPALVINNKIVSTGKVLSSKEIEILISK